MREPRHGFTKEDSSPSGAQMALFCGSMENVCFQHKTCNDPNHFALYSRLGKVNFGVGHVSLRSVIGIHILY